ncbi:MAG: peptidase M17 [Spirochaetaceae bacterium]|jgi:leucyl aminopeptidase (aminopeptidase T)|nr:peptidase M17 [Spirochaetaceae bacterium]
MNTHIRTQKGAFSDFELLQCGNSREREKLADAARIAIRDVLKLNAGEQLLIITNPKTDAALISSALYDAALDCGGRPSLIFQPEKHQIDFAEKTVIAAFNARPEAVISLSSRKLGKDEQGIASPYQHEGKGYDHIFHLLQYGEKSCRAFWSPSCTLDSFIRTVPINYPLLQRRCASAGAILSEATSVRVTAPGGTDITIGLGGRLAKSDDGDFASPGSGGNLPAGEVFISPENGVSEGVIAFDGSICLLEGEILIKTPIVCAVSGGFITGISGAAEAEELKKTINAACENARAFEAQGKLPAGKGELYAKNAKNIGELGIGLNPAALITGNMLEDEKAFHTCHFAIGENYDNDAPALIHLDGLVRNPTIIAKLPCGTDFVIEKDGEFML